MLAGYRTAAGRRKDRWLRWGASFAGAVLVVGVVPAEAGAVPSVPHFSEVTLAAGFDYEHGYREPILGDAIRFDQARHIAGGVAAGDVDGDGWVDLYVVRGDIGPNLLFRNRGDGTFEEIGAAAGVALDGLASSGPTFADIDGDGHVDLVVGGLAGSGVHVFRNVGDGGFLDVTAGSGLDVDRSTYSTAFGDFDRDGDLDLLLSHWATSFPSSGGSGTLWRNDGDFHFVDVSRETGVNAAFFEAGGTRLDISHSPTFADLDFDGWPDLLVVSDFRATRILHNEHGRFRDVTNGAVITDENGMGNAVGDFDGDGTLDLFITSVWDPDGVAEDNWGVSGNRMYRGLGDATFEDVTEFAGVRVGYWGWAATAGDFDNDGWLDLFHVNGFGVDGYTPAAEFVRDPSRLFQNQGEGRFVEVSAAAGIDDRGNGRGVVGFDYDRDGDLDLFVANSGGPPRLFRNDSGGHSIQVALRGLPPNRAGVGARVVAVVDGREQIREIRAGTNFESQDPPIAHFGLGGSDRASEVRVYWPGGGLTRVPNVLAGGPIVVEESSSLCGCGRSRLLADDAGGGSGALALSGELIARENPAADPAATGLRVLLFAGAEDEVVADVTFDPDDGDGRWRVNRGRTLFDYRDRRAERSARLRLRRRNSPSRSGLRFRMELRGEKFPSLHDRDKLRAVVTFDPSLRSAERCGRDDPRLGHTMHCTSSAGGGIGCR